MPLVLTVGKRQVGALVAQLNYLFTQNNVDAVDRLPVAELVFAEIIAAYQPACGEDQDCAEFYRSAILDGVRTFLDQLVEVVQINQEQCLLAVWGAYRYRMSLYRPTRAMDIRPDITRYMNLLPERHGVLLGKYPLLPKCYLALEPLLLAPAA